MAKPRPVMPVTLATFGAKARELRRAGVEEPEILALSLVGCCSSPSCWSAGDCLSGCYEGLRREWRDAVPRLERKVAELTRRVEELERGRP